MRKKDPAPSAPEAPKLARRHQNKHSHIKSGRTIGERREHVETASERLAARKKVKKRQNLRIIITVVGFIIVGVAVVLLLTKVLSQREVNEVETAPTTVVKTYKPSIEIIDENAAGGITTRMSEYIGKLESDFRERNYTPIKAVIPAGSIREVDFYLEGVPGYIKTTIDRGTGVTAEDADRMLRYLTLNEVSEFTYIDVRIDGKAYYK
ncbi:hypothetical protein IJ076_02035 [Candidatus Saccharibacteria bacterium]|nr:hypothetical protein [Candidatus Saccharibacteria bacterium]